MILRTDVDQETVHYCQALGRNCQWGILGVSNHGMPLWDLSYSKHGEAARELSCVKVPVQKLCLSPIAHKQLQETMISCFNWHSSEAKNSFFPPKALLRRSQEGFHFGDLPRSALADFKAPTRNFLKEKIHRNCTTQAVNGILL